MSNQKSMSTCSIICWIVAAAAGVLAMKAAWGPVPFVAALLVAVALAAFLGLVLTRLLCASEKAPAASASTPAAPEKTVDTAPMAEEAPAAKAAQAPAKAAEAPAAASSATAESASSGAESAVKGGTLLAGEEEVSHRKGDWKYDSGASGSGAAAPAAAAAPAKDEIPDYDGDGILEGTEEGKRPEGLSGPRGGKADDLKQIKGIGPKLEKLCNELGFYHFDQIAGWSADEVAWVNANLAGFKGRVSRDNWIDQAKTLAAGGATEFSKRVEDGGMY